MSTQSQILPAPTSAAWLAEGVALQRGVRPAGEGHGRHTHDYHSITVLLSSPGSSLWCYGDAKSRSVRPVAGDVFFCPAGVTTAVRSEKAYECLLLCLSPTIFHDMAIASPAIMRRDAFVRGMVTALAEEANRAEKSELLAVSLATALSIHLGREYIPSSPHVARLSDEELARIDQHITLNLHTPLTLEVLASLVGRSRYHFARLFKASIGETPHQYVIRRRVYRARELLWGGGDIAQVAAEVGFASQSHLTLHIRRAFGCTPRQLSQSL